MARRRHILKRPIQLTLEPLQGGVAFRGEGEIGGSKFTFFLDRDDIDISTEVQGRNARFLLARAYSHLKGLGLSIFHPNG